MTHKILDRYDFARMIPQSSEVDACVEDIDRDQVLYVLRWLTDRNYAIVEIMQ